MANERTFHQHFKRSCVAAPAAITTGVVPATYLDMQGHNRIVFLIDIGTVSAGSFQAQVVQATDAAGTGSKNVSGAVLPAAITTSNKWATIEVPASALDINGGFRFVSLSVTVSGTVNADVQALQYRSLQIPVDVSGDTALSANVVVAG